MKKLLFILFFFTLSLCFAKTGNKLKNSNTPFLLLYQPLFEMKPKEAATYVGKVRQLFSVYQDPSVDKVLIDEAPKPNCQKRQLATCVEALFFHNHCVPKGKKASVYCSSRAQPVPDAHFKEPVFNRIEWNKFALGVNNFCNRQKAKVCPKLAKLHDQYMKQYMAMMAERRKQKELQSMTPLEKIKKLKKKSNN